MSFWKNLNHVTQISKQDWARNTSSKKRQINDKNTVIWIIFALSVIVIYIWSSAGEKQFLEHTKFTEAIVVSDFHYKNTYGGAGYDYEFYLKNLKYSRTASVGSFAKGRKYLAAYDSLNPTSGQLLEVDITEFKYDTPDNGWRLKDIPIKLDTAYIKKMLN